MSLLSVILLSTVEQVWIRREIYTDQVPFTSKSSPKTDLNVVDFNMDIFFYILLLIFIYFFTGEIIMDRELLFWLEVTV